MISILVIAHHLLDFIVQGKITEAEALTIRLTPPHPNYWCPLPAATFPIYPGLGLASNNAGLVCPHIPHVIRYSDHSNAESVPCMLGGHDLLMVACHWCKTSPSIPGTDSALLYPSTLTCKHNAISFTCGVCT